MPHAARENDFIEFPIRSHLEPNEQRGYRSELRRCRNPGKVQQHGQDGSQRDRDLQHRPQITEVTQELVRETADLQLQAVEEMQPWTNLSGEEILQLYTQDAARMLKQYSEDDQRGRFENKPKTTHI